MPIIFCQLFFFCLESNIFIIKITSLFHRTYAGFLKLNEYVQKAYFFASTEEKKIIKKWTIVQEKKRDVKMHGTASFLRACLISIVVGELCVDAVKSSVALSSSPTQIEREKNTFYY